MKNQLGYHLGMRATSLPYFDRDFTMKKLGVTLLTSLLFAGPGAADTLEEALLAGMQNSDSLMAAQQGFLSAKQAVALATSGNDMTGTLTVKGAHTESDKKSTSGGFASSNSYSASVGVSKRIFDSGEAEARLASANYNLTTQHATYRAQEQRVMLSVIEAYLNLLTAREALALQQENVARLTAQTDATRIRLDAGTTTATRLAEAEARLARAKSNLIGAETAEETAFETYQSLTNLSADTLSLPAAPKNLPQGLGEAEDQALANHPDIQSATANLRAARSDFDVLARQVLPKVNFSISATDSEATGTMQDKLDVKAEVVLTTPFLVTNGSRARGKQQSATIERAKYSLADTTRQVALNARSSWRSLRSAIAQRQAVVTELNAAELVAEGIRTEVEFGQKIFLDQLDAEQSVSDAKVRLVQADEAIMLNRYRLLAALGQLDAEAIGMSGQIIELDDLDDPADVFTRLLPVADLPE